MRSSSAIGSWKNDAGLPHRDEMEPATCIVRLSTAGLPGLRRFLRLAEIADEESGEIIEGRLDCARCSKSIPIVRNIPRFVPSENYAANFGFQWNRYDRIQLDKVMGNNLSRDRWNATTGWPARMEGQRILEAGCGAGRFTELALETGAELYSFDLSDAVDANLRNHAAQNLNIFQASIYEIPLRPAKLR